MRAARPGTGRGGIGISVIEAQLQPRAARWCFGQKAQQRMLSPACAELRCVCGAQTMRLTLSSEEVTDVVPFFGLFQSRERYTIGPEPQTIEVTLPERVAQLDPAFCAGMPFSPRVARLLLAGGPLYVHDIEGEAIRPPRVDELPRTRYLAYGTSTNPIKDPITGEQEEPAPADLYWSVTTDMGESYYLDTWYVNGEPGDGSEYSTGDEVTGWPWMAKGDQEQGEVQLRDASEGHWTRID